MGSEAWVLIRKKKTQVSVFSLHLLLLWAVMSTFEADQIELGYFEDVRIPRYLELKTISSFCPSVIYHRQFRTSAISNNFSFPLRRVRNSGVQLNCKFCTCLIILSGLFLGSVDKVVVAFLDPRERRRIRKQQSVQDGNAFHFNSFNDNVYHVLWTKTFFTFSAHNNYSMKADEVNKEDNNRSICTVKW